MNCPHHIDLKDEMRSYRDLPCATPNLARFIAEQSGELHGLTRVRGFTVTTRTCS